MARTSPVQACLQVAEAGCRRGAKHRPVFVDRPLAALVHLHHAVTHDVLSRWFGGTGPPSPVPSQRCGGPCSPSEAAPSVPECGCGPSPRSSTISAPAERSASSTEPRSGSGADCRTRRPGQVRLRQEQVERGKEHGRHGRRQPDALFSGYAVFLGFRARAIAGGRLARPPAPSAGRPMTRCSHEQRRARRGEGTARHG